MSSRLLKILFSPLLRWQSPMWLKSQDSVQFSYRECEKKLRKGGHLWHRKRKRNSGKRSRRKPKSRIKPREKRCYQTLHKRYAEVQPTRVKYHKPDSPKTHNFWTQQTLKAPEKSFILAFVCSHSPTFKLRVFPQMPYCILIQPLLGDKFLFHNNTGKNGAYQV